MALAAAIEPAVITIDAAKSPVAANSCTYPDPSRCGGSRHCVASTVAPSGECERETYEKFPMERAEDRYLVPGERDFFALFAAH